MSYQENQTATIAVTAAKEPDSKLVITEHLLSTTSLAEELKVDFDASNPTKSKGLTDQEAKTRLEQYGRNQLSPPKRIHPVLQFLRYFLDLFNVMLWVAGVIAYIIYAIDPPNNFANVYIGGILLGVCVMNAFIEFYQSRKSQAILASFMNLIPAKCNVIRDGNLSQIEAINLVVGDVVYIQSGDKVPADLRLFYCNELKVDNSSLTGESEPQERLVSNILKNPLEATNLAYNGTLVMNGEGYGCVIRTGDNTIIGQIAFLAGNEKRRASPMALEIERFVSLVATAASIVTVIFFFVSKFQLRNSWAISFNFGVGTFTAFVPQGLPATVTILLSLAAKRMAMRNVLVKDLQGVETLGAITLLATDKTGTLTRNQMTVTFFWAGEKLYYTLLQGKMDIEAIPLNSADPAPNEILHMSVLCSRARFENNEGPITTRTILGDATEAGLLRNAALKLPNYDTAAEQFPKVFEIPFNSDNKWAMTIHKKSHKSGSLTLYLKGAPERVLKLCSTFHCGDKIVSLTNDHKRQFDEMYGFMASKGHRVLAFAILEMPESQYPANFEFKKDPKNYPTENLTFLGLVSLEDPPKHGVREAIGRCREAGIKVMMVTGDHPLTAEAIGRKINLMVQDTKEMIAKRRSCALEKVNETDVNAIVIHGESIDSLKDDDWDRIFSKDEIIFARTSPKHKLLIVKRAQSIGHIVGVTGDGVNDSPALKKADLGISMNISGSDVSKEAAAMILIDDNFASTVNGIEEGRLIFQNLKKSIRYTLTHLMPEALSFAWDTTENKTGLMKLEPRKPVTPESIARLKRIEARGSESWVSRLINQFKDPAFEENLVDGEVLSWAYVEAGTIEAIGCFTCFYFALSYSFGISVADTIKYGAVWGLATTGPITLANGVSLSVESQVEALAQGQSAFYLALLIQQCFNLFACKARLRLPFGSFMWSNMRNFYGTIFGAVFTFAIVYIPPVNVAFGTSYRTTPYVWIIAFAFGWLLFIYSTVRFLLRRLWNPIKYSKDVVGLDLHPTRFSTGR